MQHPADRILEALVRGAKDEALRLIAKDGVWLAFCDPTYFETEAQFPIFSSPAFIPAFIRESGLESQLGDRKLTAQRVGQEFFSFASDLESTLTLNPCSHFEWELDENEVATIVSLAQKHEYEKGA